MATIKINITVDEDYYARFLKIAEENGIKTSTWISAQMKKFVDKMEEPKSKK
ncbi:MAG: hypothetical protein Q8911_00035 [Bacillota bacterium]|nr:hypothetical protein [Bacillota bacterium]